MFCCKCGAQLADGSAFCSHCGSPVAPVAPVAPVVQEVPQAAPVAPVAPVVQEAPQAAPVAPVEEPEVAAAPVYAAPEAPQWTAPAPAVAVQPAYAMPTDPQPAPKKKGSGPIIAILAVIAALAVAACALFAAGVFDNDSGKDDDSDAGTSTTTANADIDDNDNGEDGDHIGIIGGGSQNVVPNSTTTTTRPAQTTTEAPPVVSNSYDKGAIRDGAYYNKWAMLSYPIPEGWVEGTAAEYATYENSVTECGLYIKQVDEASNAYNIVNIVFENLKGASVSVEDYTETLCNSLTTQYTSMGYTVDMLDPFSSGLAGYYWQDVTVTLNNGALHQRYLITEKDGYIISLIVTSLDDSSINALVNKLTFAP